jgi:hypothetical protein
MSINDNGSWSYTIPPVTANCTITVNFIQGTFNVTAKAGAGGTINPSGTISVAGGMRRSYTITPDSGYNVFGVTGTCGGSLNGNIYTTNPIPYDCTVTAAFTKSLSAYYTVTVSVMSMGSNGIVGGIVNPSGVVQVASGAFKSFTITPYTGYKIMGIFFTCGGSFVGSYSTGGVYTTDPVANNCTLTTTFGNQ